MKDYLVLTRYTVEQKQVIMKVARLLYIRLGIGRKDALGWEVCDDDDRNESINKAIDLYQSIIEPYAVEFAKEARLELRRLMIKQIEVVG